MASCLRLSKVDFQKLFINREGIGLRWNVQELVQIIGRLGYRRRLYIPAFAASW